MYPRLASGSSLSRGAALVFTGEKTLRFCFADAAVAPSYKKLTNHYILSYHISRENGCLKKGIYFRFKHCGKNKRIIIKAK
jgi:hypothetical protein